MILKPAFTRLNSSSYERRAARRYLLLRPRVTKFPPKFPFRPSMPKFPWDRRSAREASSRSLWWHTKDDLDLMIKCPVGLKGSNSHTKGPGICGDGILDHDANRKLVNPVSDPVEHIVWQRIIPDGQYEVWVKPSYSFRPATIKYEVRVEFDGEQRICSGEVYLDRARETGTRQRAITSCRGIHCLTVNT